MKLHYIVFGKISDGIMLKLQEKIKSLQSVVDSIRLILISDIQINDLDLEKNCVIVRRHRALDTFGNIPFFWRASIWIYRFLGAYHFYRIVSQINKDDIIVLRYPIADYFLYKSFQLLGRRKFIFEHNTKELNELELRSKNSYWFRYLFISEKKYGKLLRDRASCLVAVSHDFLTYQQTTYNTITKGKVISNGYSVSQTERRVLQKKDGLNFLMLIGSYADWHGLDIMLNALKASIPENPTYKLHVVGTIPEDIRVQAEKELGNHIKFHGHLTAKERYALANECHIGIGALGLTRLGIQVSSSLKVREYLAYGMPSILSVDDEDIDQAAFTNKFCLMIKMDNNTFNLFSAVNSFGQLVYSQDHIDRIREYALQHIDYSIKAQQYAEIFKELRLN